MIVCFKDICDQTSLKYYIKTYQHKLNVKIFVFCNSFRPFTHKKTK